ncbi:winged helix-turn-helix domain-containing protein [uncultured Paludibaculum sp.]|uniref:winged helix-turn-helix domain-containing protein n=1 Tax=uncultured Paludibaculum sp. TaxID=1765020 RepID=UPI002AAB74C2|nr:winged helix-turn-helix domain-containing protein [uncultured Paludibaculum sp.]
MHQEVFHFGPFLADVQLRTLARGHTPVAVTPKVFDALLIFLKSDNQVVTREDLCAQLWPGQVVTDANVNQHISMLRKALGDGGSGERYLVTLPGRGYQWVAPVSVPHSAETVNVAWRLTALAAGVVIMLAGLVIWNQRQANVPFEFGQRHSLTRLPGSEYQPAVTRDGAKVAFIWDQDGANNPAVYVRGPDDDEPRRVSEGHYEHSSPAWSPDGRLLAYIRYEASSLRLVITPERGGAEREIVQLYRSRYGMNCRHLDWSPDGTKLVVDDKESAAQAFGLFLVDIATGSRTRLTRPPDAVIGDVDPRFSPDGRQVAFVRMSDRFRQDLWVTDLSGANQKRLTSADRTISGHDWSPDGRRIYFGSNRRREFEVWTANVDTGAAQGTNISSANPLQLSVGRSGGRMVYSDLQQDLNIWKLDLDAARHGANGWSRVISSTGEEILPFVSPDGTRLCYRSDRSGEGQLWVSGVDGGRAMQVTRGAVHPVACRWSPDSRKLAFNDALTQRLYVVDAAGGTPQILGGPDVLGGHPMFDSSGRSVYYNNQDVIWQVFMDGVASTRILASTGIHQKFLSRDGRSLFFTRRRTDSTIWRYDFATKTADQVVDGLLAGYWGAWALGRDGIYLLAESRQPMGGAAVLFHPLNGGPDREITRFPGQLPPIGTSTWSLSPDERYLYCVRVDVSHSDLTQVEGVR